MKNTMKRGLSLLLVLTLFVSLLSGLTFHVDASGTVNYVYSGNYVYNWGTREEKATFLSPMAEAFYEDNNITYEELAALSGSTSISSVPSSALYGRLKSLMSSNQSYQTSYNATKNLFQYTDCQKSGAWNSKKISSFYSGVGIGPAWDSDEWNREHTWPNSKGDAAGNGENDIMMLRPTSISENSSRGNKAYGESSSYYYPNDKSNNVYDLRGDVARIILYTYVRWECTNTGSSYNPNGIFGTDGVFESKQVLLDWMEADPVDTWELGRNDSVESITGTRNVFVDYPELSFIMFGEEVPSDMQTPSGEAVKNAYTVTATTNNSSYGTVSVNGNVITATPKTGYQVSGYTVTSGTATVTQSGNIFTVRASSNCTVCINFAERSKYTVAFSEDGTVQTTLTPYAGDALQLPNAAVSVDSAYTFTGWVQATVNNSTVKPATVYIPGNSYTPTGSHTLYGLYTCQYMDQTYYTTAICRHEEDFNTVDAVPATCTASGNTAGYFCNECRQYFGGYEVIPATGHSYTGVVTPPTATEEGYTTYTCGSCNDSYVADYVEALGETYTVHFRVPTGVEPVADMLCGKNGIILPSAGIPTEEQNYKFVGWTTDTMADTETAPTFYAAGSNYIAAENTTLYALYTYMAGSAAVTGAYQQVTAAPSDWEGEYVMTGTATGTNTTYAFLADGTTPNATAAAKKLSDSGMVLSGTSLTNVTDTYLIVVEKVGEHYSLRLKGADDTLYLMTTNANSGFNTAADTTAENALWDLSFTNGEVVIRNVEHTNRSIRFNETLNQFRAYTGSYNAVVLYGSGGTLTYTTLDSTTQCEHAATEYVINDNGTHSTKCTACGEVLSTEPHSYGSGTSCVCGNTVFGFAGMSVALESRLEVNFVVNSTDVKDGYYAIVEHETADGVVETRLDNWDDYSATLKKVSYIGVAAKQMVDNLTVTIYNADGEQVSVSYTRTVKDYLEGRINNASVEAAVKVVAVDFLNFGAAAQNFFGYKKDTLANADLSAEQQAMGTTEDAVSGYVNEQNKGDSMGTQMEAEFEILPSIVFANSLLTDVAYANYSYVTVQGETKTNKIEKAEFGEFNASASKITIKGVAYGDGVNLITVELCDAEGNPLYTAADSVASYAVRNKAKDEIYLNLLKLVHSSNIAFG